MNSYLSLAAIQAKVHGKQNLMTIFCIALAVFLITGVFTMADVGVQNELAHMTAKHGSWHISLSGISEQTAQDIAGDAAVDASSWYGALNYGLEEDYTAYGRKVVVTGAQQDYALLMDVMREGVLPAEDGYAAVSENMRDAEGLRLGDHITLAAPAGEYGLTISGFCDNGYLAEYDAYGIIVPYDTLKRMAVDNGGQPDPVYYVRFLKSAGIRKSIDRLTEKYALTEEQVSENAAVLSLMGLSKGGYINGLYGIAAILMLLVVFAGVLMIAGSMNTNVAQRTQYFGMLRCIGTGKGQVRRLVLLEALNWCVAAVPAGALLATAATWMICFIMRYGIGGEWSDLPLFRVSVPGTALGASVGVLTVMLAAFSPARRASGVSPMAAVSGNLDNSNIRTAAKTGIVKIDRALGVHHAISKKKNLLLLTGSFALSIVIFLSFSVMIDWIGHALTTNKLYTQDLSVYYEAFEGDIPKELSARLAELDGVERVFGRMHVCSGVGTDKGVSRIDLISYEDSQFVWSKNDLLEGDIEKVRSGSGYVMTVFEKNNPLTLGDTIIMNGKTLTVAAVLSDSPFSSSDIPTVLCSENTFTDVTGISSYAIIDIQLTKQAGEDTVSAIRRLIGGDMKLADFRETTRETNGTYQTFCLLVYGFLGMVALITVFNIVNCISMSAASRNRQYGIMRAVGMDDGQIKRMILAEALTYAVSGSIAGCVFGIPLHAFFFRRLISSYFGDAWRLPLPQLAVILCVVLGSAVLAAHRPAKRLTQSTVTETVSYY